MSEGSAHGWLTIQLPTFPPRRCEFSTSEYFIQVSSSSRSMGLDYAAYISPSSTMPFTLDGNLSKKMSLHGIRINPMLARAAMLRNPVVKVSGIYGCLHDKQTFVTCEGTGIDCG